MGEKGESLSTPSGSVEEQVLSSELPSALERVEAEAPKDPRLKEVGERLRRLEGRVADQKGELADQVVDAALQAANKTETAAPPSVPSESSGSHENTGLNPLFGAFQDLIAFITAIFKDPLGESKKVEKPEGQKPSSERERDSWPEPIDSNDMEYPEAPFSTRAGRAFHLSSGFGMRLHPVHGDHRHHGGIDLNIGSGFEDFHEPLYVRVPLRVEWVGASSRGGNGIRLADPERPGEVYYFAHLDELPPFSPGDTLEPGVCFAKVGNTGTSTSPHLHLELERDGQELDPMERFGRALRLG